MKKLLTISLVIVMVLALSGCGAPAADANSSASEPTVTETPKTTEAALDPQLQEELKVLGSSAEKLEALFNELTPIATANGWDNNEVFVKEKAATYSMFEVGKEIVKDPTILEGTSAKDMIDGINGMATEWDTNVRAKVSNAYVPPSQ